MNANEYRNGALFLSAVVSVWIIKSLRYTLWSQDRAIGRTVSSLLAGIVLVDWLAVPHLPKPFEFIFIGLFSFLRFYFNGSSPQLRGSTPEVFHQRIRILGFKLAVPHEV